MPLSGGDADKVGNRYEDWWTVYCMIDVMDEKAASIRLEPPGVDGFEFWLNKDGFREYHQVKRQHGKSGRWTLSELESKAILSHFWNKLQDSQDRCVFVSTHSAYQLDELSYRASGAASWDEFNHNFLTSKDSRDAFNELCQRWSNSTRTEAYEALKRIRVETISEHTLQNFVEHRLNALVDAVLGNVAACLIKYAHENIHHELSADTIWKYLENQKFRRRHWTNDPRVWDAIDKQNNRYLSRLQREIIIPENIIPRDEVQTILQDLTSIDGKRGVMISGEAGIGKSSVILQVIHEFQENNLPLLAFRIDTLTSVNSPKELGRQLDLPESPACILASVANGRECVLIIDQLDAVSEISGRTPYFFECIYEIITEAQAHRNMWVLLACRKFDLNNDYRFRQLLNEEHAITHVSIERLASERVREIVSQLGVDANRLQTGQTEILSVPLHLKLFAEIVHEREPQQVDFTTVNDLYGVFWEEKQRRIRRRLDATCQWTEVIDRLCDYMSRQQEQDLFVPLDILDEFQKDADAMVAEHVLVKDNKKYAFFHHSFFDYAFARRFFARGYRLMEWLQEGEQHLFRRSQVRQILIYSRGREFQPSSQYINDLQDLLFSEDVRFHIKHVVFALLKEVSDPTKEEWEILFTLLKKESYGLSGWAWYTIANSAAWFQLLDTELGLISKWLRGEDEEWVQKAFFLLARVQKYFPDRNAELVKPYLGTSERWNERLIQLMKAAYLGGGVGAGRKLFDLFLRLIDEGLLDHPKRNSDGLNKDFWNLLSSTYKEHPCWACEAIQHYLDHCQVSRNSGTPNPFDNKFIPDSQYAEEVIMGCARKLPTVFMNAVLPFMLDIIKSTATTRDSSGVLYDPVWRFRSYKRGPGMFPVSDVDESLLSGMESAMRHLASEEPEVFKQKIAPLRQFPVDTIHYLLIRAYDANGKELADEATEYLCSIPARLKTGYTNAFSYEKSLQYWATRQLLEAITSHCSGESINKLETTILNFYSDWEQDPAGRQERGFAQFVLLEGIVPSRRSPKVLQRLKEWQRKFRRLSAKAPTSEKRILTSVPSPISQEAASKMTDEQWLKAITKYDYEDSQITNDFTLMGGVHQLSGILREEVKKAPERFANLLCKLPDTTNTYYVDAVLWGMPEISVNPGPAFTAALHCHQIPGRPYGRSICYLLSKLEEYPFSKDIVKMISWYAIKDPDPSQDAGNDVVNHGISTARGRAAETVAKLMFSEEKYFSSFLPIIKKMVCDPSLSVRACVAHTLVVVLKYDRNTAVGLFQKLCKTKDVLLATHHVEEFLYYALQTHFHELSPLLERMLASSLPEVAQAGARQACLISLTEEKARPLAEYCIWGTETQRLGAAQIFSRNLLSTQLRSFCEDALLKLFNDPNEDIRDKAATCFHTFEGDQLEEYIPLVEVFVQSAAFSTNPGVLLEVLQKTTAKLPDITCHVCERFVNEMKSESSEGGPDQIDTRIISQLLFRLYSQSSDGKMKSRCLAMIDRMLYLDWYGIHDVLKQYER